MAKANLARLANSSTALPPFSEGLSLNEKFKRAGSSAISERFSNRSVIMKRRVRKERREFLEKHSGLARQILEELLEKYAEHGTAQFVLPDVLQVPPISDHGNVIEIAKHFGGAEKLREAIHELQTILYAA